MTYGSDRSAGGQAYAGHADAGGAVGARPALGAIAGRALKGFAAASLILACLSPARAADTPVRGGTLNIMVERDVKSLDPLFGNSVSIDRKVFNLYAESLLLLDAKGDLVPNLAESWEYADGGKTILFKIRQGISFQDGTPLNAAAVKFNLDRLLDPAWNVPLKTYVADMRAVELVDDYTVRVRLEQPNAPFLSMMAAEPGSILSPTALKERGEEFGRRPVGTGPFVIVSRTNNEIVAKRFDGYWQKAPDGKPLPYLDGVKLLVNPSESIRLIQLRSGAASLTDAVAPRSIVQVKSDANLVVLDDARLGVSRFLNFNVTRPPFDNIELRQAVALAINRAAMANALSPGTGIALVGVEPPGSRMYDASLKGHGFDRAKAREQLAKLAPKEPLTLSVIQRDYDIQIAQLVQAMLKDVGVEIKVEVLERQSWIQKIFAYNYDFSISQDALQRPDPDQFYANNYSRKAANNYSGFKNDAVFDMVDKARVELDWDKRKALYGTILQQLLDNTYQTPLYWSPTAEIASKKVQGIKREGTMVWLYQTMWLAP
ncbi:ABC transporter substrate-binding protein [Bosea sp. BK604]|uniref:ABC transporter substrate-binding protein n=1 Tax=Bosea sp. BK604 TaxID=2512180 RepID=UPI001049FA63|nr:ABC transporter substrate-binding protein [Bosea sp. BK604]TCR63165.1 peptide/nickel transport system substrate-binding protein [Bosea sp. BK604]